MPTTPVFSDASDARVTPMNQPVSGNVLDNAVIPRGLSAQVTGFTIQGSTRVYPPGATVPLTDPSTGAPVGTVTLAADGSYTFTPAPGYVGPVPVVDAYLQRSDGQTAASSLTIDVLPGAHLVPGQRAQVCVPRGVQEH